MDNYQLLLDSSYRFLSIRPRSEKEVRDYLKKKIRDVRYKIAEEDYESIINKILDKLKEHKFVNDIEFVRFWIEQRTKVRPKALRFIKYELKQKGISEDLVNEVLEAEDFETETDLEKALKIAKQRLPRLKNDSSQKQYEKLSRFLAYKGFNYDVIKDVIAKVLPKRYNSG